MPRGASPDLAGFENRFTPAPAPAPAPETQQLMDAFGMGLPGVQAAPQTSIVDGLTGFQTERLPDGSVRSVQTIGGMTEAEAQAIRDSLERTQNMTTDEAADAAMEELEREIQEQSSLDPDRIRDAVTGGFREGIGAMAPAFETAGSIDTTPFQQVSPNIRQVNPLSPVERVMRSLGMKTRRAPRSQLYSPSKKEDSFFDLRRLLPSIDT